MLAGRSFFTFRKLISYIHKQDYYQHKCCGYLSEGNRVPKFHFSSFLSMNTVINRNSIPRRRLDINVRKLNKSFGNETLVPIKGMANQAAEMFMDRPEKAFNQGRYFFFFTKAILSFSRTVD